MRLTLICSLFLMAGAVQAQSYTQRINHRVAIGDTSQVHQLILRDYTRLRGTVLEVRRDSIVMQVASVPEAVRVPTFQMRHIGILPRSERLQAVADGDVPAMDDLTLVRTALPFPRRKRLKTVMLVYNSLEWQLDRHVQLGVGAALPFGLLLNQRYRTSLTPYLHVGVSNETLLVPFLIFGEDGFPAVGDLTTMLTVGSGAQFLHLGYGIFYNLTDGTEPVPNFRVGAGTRISRRVHLYGELVGVLEPDDRFTLLPSLNLARTVRRHRWSFGLATSFVEREFNSGVPVPYVSYSLYY